MILPPDTANQCGYSPFLLPKDHPFTPICQMHDKLYEDHLNGFPGRPLEVADKAMLHGFLGVAKERRSVALRIQAYVFFGLVTAFRLTFRRGRK